MPPFSLTHINSAPKGDECIAVITLAQPTLIAFHPHSLQQCLNLGGLMAKQLIRVLCLLSALSLSACQIGG